MATRKTGRAALPPSAFVYPSKRAYPVPTKAQAKKAGISETARLRMHRAALSYSAQKRTMGSYATVAAVVRRRSTVAQRAQPRVTGRRRTTTVRRRSR
jgi:hypothetical protein